MRLNPSIVSVYGAMGHGAEEIPGQFSTFADDPGEAGLDRRGQLVDVVHHRCPFSSGLMAMICSPSSLTEPERSSTIIGLMKGALVNEWSAAAL